ncbi:MAG: methionine--tRNA ligase, partial [Gammaproteobacteria bacterium]
IDLNLDDFVARTNSDLVGKFVNIASRCAGFITKRFDGRLAAKLDDPELFEEFVLAGDSLADEYESREFARAMRRIMSLADLANRYIDEHKPWQLAKDEAQLPRVQIVCTQGINLFRLLATYLKPVLPGIAAGAEEFLNSGELTWKQRETPLLGTEIRAFKPLLTRLDQQSVDNMVERTRAGATTVTEDV